LKIGLSIFQIEEQLEKVFGRIGVELALFNRRVEKLQQELYIRG
jgi:hypothetical protein